ncbi:MAG: hypothetical protein HYV35_10210 [Lentisphaerae bacterium]|nr:hypothetical protein [Lentisphaerota bacterium]
MDGTVLNPAWRGFPFLGWVAIAATLGMGVLLTRQNLQLPDPGYAGLPELGQGGSAEARLPRKYMVVPSPYDWPQIDEPALSFNGLTFKQLVVEPLAASLGPLAKRFRLAGTFFAASGHQQSRKAILDDLAKKAQYLVAEGELLEPSILVVSIARDHIVLRDGSTDEQLWLSFSGGAKPEAKAGQMAAAAIQEQADKTLVRFGKRTGERRWVLQRDQVLRYYQELLNNPDRLAKVFESLKPVYRTGKIAGYTLDIEGEGDIFQAFGLRQGDIIRQVNSLPMISQSRAEYFINEFVKDRVNAFVLDIERDAQPEKMIYLLR